MSKQHDDLYRRIWDQLNSERHEVSLDDVDEEFKQRVIIDVGAARDAACKAARRAVDTARTKFHGAQLSLPTLADDDEYIVIGDSLRVQLARATEDDLTAELDISDANLAKQFAANQAKHILYRKLVPYLRQGMNYNEAVTAYWLDHPQQQAAD